MKNSTIEKIDQWKVVSTGIVLEFDPESLRILLETGELY